MKKFSVILMALALMMGLSQCKKDNQNGNGMPVLEGEEVQITLTLNSGSSNSKADVIPDDGQGIAPVRFKARNGDIPGDYIWVAYDGKNVGHLECTSLSTSTDQNGNQLGVFTGNITIAKVGDQPLYFYFLGNKQPTFVHDSDDHGIGYIVDLSDQSGELPVIAYAMSEQNYPSSDGNYTVKYNWLKNQCALVKFTMENIYGSGTAMSTANRNDQNANALYKTTKPITIYGMNNQVTIDLASPAASADALWGPSSNWNHNLDASFSWDIKTDLNGDPGDGAITLYSPSASEDVVRYAIVAPGSYTIEQGNLYVPFDAANDDYGFYGTYRLDGAIQNNAYYKDAKIDLVWHSGAFSVSSNKQVVFSRGNLQYKNISGKWRFAKHQYDWVGGTLRLVTPTTQQGNVVLNENDNNDETYAARSGNHHIGDGDYAGWIDLYGWGTGDNPMKHSIDNNDYTDWHEWGEHNIVNSGKPSNTEWWVTLKHHEYSYLIEDRSNALSKLGGAQITTSDGTTVNGMIMLPDVWNGPSITPLTKPAAYHGEFTDNEYTEAQWQTMEAYGAVFLPAAGYRNGTSFDGGTTTHQNRGVYNTFTESTSAASWSIKFEALYTSNVFDMTGDEYMAPDNGHAVRLVHELDHGNKLGKIFGK